MTPPERALLIWNPVAGRDPERRQKQVERIAAVLQAGGWAIDTAPTEVAGGAERAAEAGIAAGATALIACGGDGTLNQVAHAIARTATDERPALGVAPVGTANVFAHAIGCPTNAAAVGAWLLRARRRRMLLGRAVRASGTQHFLAVASVGLDAHVVHHVTAEEKSFWGKWAYAGIAVREASHFPAAQVAFQTPTGGGVADGIIAGLTHFYGGRMRLGPDTATLPILLALRGAPWTLLPQSLALLATNLAAAPGVEQLAGLPIEITAPALPLELDGEAAGQTPVKFEIVPEGVEVLVA